MANTATLKDLEAARSFLVQGLPDHLAQPKVGIVCGSGLGGLVEIIKDKHEFAYSDIPGFVVSTGNDHAMNLDSESPPHVAM